MYASNRYEREMMRIPQNYSGNAFAASRRREDAQEDTVPSDSHKAAPNMQVMQEDAAEVTPPSDMSQASETLDLPPTAEAETPTEHTARASGISWLREGIGHEELLLIGLLYLLRSEGTVGQSDELLWLLLLLLVMG